MRAYLQRFFHGLVLLVKWASCEMKIAFFIESIKLASAGLNEQIYLFNWVNQINEEKEKKEALKIF
jgi:hypothetical protein